jgi:hypothetical protein
VILGNGFVTFALSLGMIAALVLGFAGIRMVVTGRDRQRGGLMIGVAVVLVINVLIWAWPAGTPPTP